MSRSAPHTPKPPVHPFRALTARRLGMALLLKLHREGALSPELAFRICRAYRRAWRLQGLRGITLARRLRLPAAVRAPIAFLSDPILSARCWKGALRPVLRGLLDRPLAEGIAIAGHAARVMRFLAGRRRIRREWEPA